MHTDVSDMPTHIGQHICVRDLLPINAWVTWVSKVTWVPKVTWRDEAAMAVDMSLRVIS